MNNHLLMSSVHAGHYGFARKHFFGYIQAQSFLTACWNTSIAKSNQIADIFAKTKEINMVGNTFLIGVCLCQFHISSTACKEIFHIGNAIHQFGQCINQELMVFSWNIFSYVDQQKLILLVAIFLAQRHLLVLIRHEQSFRINPYTRYDERLLIFEAVR